MFYVRPLEYISLPIRTIPSKVKPCLSGLDKVDTLLNLGDELREHGLESGLLVLRQVTESVDLLHT